ncbi:MAG: EI24 domain-containing protein [Deltaproteobacteria bacterium]|nr:EI24 domain-containing protein [Deltaproteobacteria bacterium]
MSPSAVAAGAGRDPRQGGAAVRFFRGFGYLFEAWGFVFGKHPGLVAYCLAPLVINLLAFGGAAVGLYYYYDDLVALIWARPSSWRVIFWYLLYVFIFLAVMLLAYLGFFVVQAVLSAPFNDLLSERVEELAYDRPPPPFSVGRLLAGLGRTVLHELGKLGIYVSVMLPLFLLNLFVPVLGPVVFLCVGFYVTALFFAYDFMDYCMGRRAWRFGRKWAALKAHRALTLGFGSALAVALLVPVVGLLCVPMAAVGGTLLFCDLERVGAFDQAHGADPLAASPGLRG